MFFQTFIDIEDWDLADWKGLAFFHDPEGVEPPCMGIVFENMEKGRKIFAYWKTRLGEVDRYNELRIGIIEGEMLGRESGYTAYISSDPENTAERVKAEGGNLDFDRALIISRSHRMNPEPGSPHLATFKREFAKHKKYSILPVSLNLEAEFGLAIEKSELHFRQSSEVKESDFDSLAFPPGYFQGDGTVH